MGIVETVTDVPCSMDKDMDRESISIMKIGNAEGPSGVLSEIVKNSVHPTPFQLEGGDELPNTCSKRRGLDRPQF